jgi:hypothetical protein
MSFTSDPATTRSRIELLQEYMTGEVLGPDGVVCWSLDGCKRSALFDRVGAPRPGVEFAGGQLLHVGHHYDLTEGGRALRILVIAMETGRPDGGVGLERRRVQVAQSAALAMTARNPHMQGVTNALRLAVGRVPGADGAGEMLDLAGDDQSVHLFDAFAMTNIRLCSAFATGTTDSRGTSVMSKNCLRHLVATLEILEPTLCIVQGVDVATDLQPVIGRRSELGPNLAQVTLGGIDTLLATFAHPSARPPLRWGGLTGVPYLYDTLGPAIGAARAAMSGAAGVAPPEPPLARPPSDMRPAGVRREFSLPRLREAAGSRSTPIPGSGARSTHQVAADARALVVREVVRRGGTAREVRVGARTELRVMSPAGAREVRVISRRAGDWQTSIREGDTSIVSGSRFWVFVDLAQGTPSYYIAPEGWVVDDIHTEHEEYLARNGGRRAQTEGSTHHRIQTSRVQQWKGRWNLLGLGDMNTAVSDVDRATDRSPQAISSACAASSESRNCR